MGIEQTAPNLHTLRIDSVVRKTEALAQRVRERFPERKLTALCAELVEVTKDAQQRIDGIIRPNYLLRTGIVLVLLIISTSIIIGATRIRWTLDDTLSIIDLVAIVEASVNDLLLLFAAIYGLVTTERRLKQRKIQSAMHELRTTAHVIDMFQLTKDPQRILLDIPNTPSSPDEQMTAFELMRYLDYCSEMLSAIGKLAAIYAQYDDDAATLAAVNEIENLTMGLSSKIWQKIMIVQSIVNEQS